MKKKQLINLTLSAMFLALALLLPLLTGQIQTIGKMLLPMHIPVLLCGFICGWQWGFAVGVAAPILRSLIFNMPPMMPTAVAMAFELAVYGLMCGLLWKLLPKKTLFLYVDLIAAMIAGRLVWGGVMWILTGLGKAQFGFAAFWAGAVANAIPGIILQIVLIPLLVLAVRKVQSRQESKIR